MKTTKKIIALMMALVMVLVMNTVAMAAGDEGRTVGGKDDIYQGTGNANSITPIVDTTNNKIPITKSVVFINADNAAVYEPDITYTYSVAPARVTNGEQTVTISSAVSSVLDGPAGGVTGTDIAFGTSLGGTPTTPVNANANGTDVERTGELTVNLDKFTHAGIYRFVITETTSPADITTVGLTARESGYQTTRYLDVYIQNGASGLEMYGAVMFKSTTGTPGKDNLTNTSEKTTGFAPAVSGVELKNDPTVDRYTTYNFTIKKEVVGSLANKTNEFPIYVTVNNSIANAKCTYSKDGSETFTDATLDSGVLTLSKADFAIGSDSIDSNLALKHNDFITLTGVPSAQSNKLNVSIKEYNNTVDSYTLSASATKGTVEVNSGTAMSPSTGSDYTKPFNIVDNEISNQKITLHNTLADISPTGYISRFAPYALILIGGIVLMLIAVKRKKHHDEED